MDHCPGQFSSKKIMKIFKTDFYLKTLLLSISHNVDKNYQNRTSPKIVSTVSASKIYLYHISKTAKAKTHRVEIS